MLHHIFLKTGMTPDEFFKKPIGVRAFLMASMRIALEANGKRGEN